MSGIPASVEVQHEELNAAHKLLPNNGTSYGGIAPNFSQDAGEEECTVRTMTVRRKSKRKEDGPVEIICGWIVEHQIGLSVNLLILLSLTHLCFPRARRHARKFFELSYYNPTSGEYRAGWNDAWMVSFWIVVFTGLRAAVMEYIFIPVAKRGGAKGQREQIRFAEQAWLAVYTTTFWCVGVYLLWNSDYLFNFTELWTNWPNREMDGLRKWYILVQYAFWLQQILVVNLEERRKDHWQMLAHHIVTCALIFTSYGYHQTKVANLILCTMDSVDLVFPLAKCLKYLGYTTVCDVLFGLFITIWFVTRHVFFCMICYSVWADIPANIDYGCYSGQNGSIQGPFPPPDRLGHLVDPFRNPEGTVCFNHKIKWGFLSALLFLQFLTLVWFTMIVKVAIRVLKGGDADDVRSDDEGDDEEELLDEKSLLSAAEQIEEMAAPPPYEEEVGVEAITLKGRKCGAKHYKKGSGSASGVSLPHSDRKELLGRIGCDKGV
ncbi:TLC domain-containing protein [Marssonina coronariae]|uniref:TLC domain-containing protein n=1 Tax=Diplocarpon coronariae TaxID=2795749 RepID=A0A218YXF3_9HELO|nr:TLC domain-containing protein [Marssonina coronariae]